jgi:outer membrane protein assembly factor BamA
MVFKKDYFGNKTFVATAAKVLVFEIIFFFTLTLNAQKPTFTLTINTEETAVFEKIKPQLKYPCFDSAQQPSDSAQQNTKTPKHQNTKTLKYQFPTSDTTQFRPICTEIIRLLQEKAYLTASIEDFFIIDSTTGQATLHIGVQMYWATLRTNTTITQKYLASVGYRTKAFEEKPLQHTAILKLQKTLLEHAENNGYPFAQVYLDSVEMESNGGISAILQVKPNQFYTFSEIKNEGELRLPKAFLSQFLGIKEGMPYSREKVLSIKNRLRTLSFLEISGNPMVRFFEEEAVINLFLKKKKSSRFDFIIGLLPQTDANNNRLLLTGNLNASFQNALNQGERFTAEIERLRPETQKMDIQASYPYLFGLPLGIDGHLNIFKRDSTWLDAFGDLGVRYMFEGDDYLKFFWENKSTSLLQVDTNKVRQFRRLPNNLDLRQNGLGVETSVTRLDFRFNPRKGWAVTLKGSAGFSTVLRNSQIENLRDADDPEFSFRSLYDSVANKAVRYRFDAKTEAFLPLFKRSTLKIALRGGAILSPTRPIFTNEQYRLGGNKLLRGFDEESLFATRFVVSTLEYRLLIGQYSYLSTFADYGYIENITKQNRSYLHPLGLGAGLTFETKAGIFGISVAVGQQGTQKFDFRAAKFHLGYVSLF